MVDAHFNALARQRKAEQFKAERQTKAFASKLARVRAEMASGPKVISIDAPLGQADGELSARWLRGQLPSDGRDVVLQVHCEGGAVLECLAMIDVLQACPGKVKAIVSSMALSAASLLICGSCDEIEVTKNSYLMLHDARMDEADTSDSNRLLIDSLVDDMADIYSARTRKPVSEIRRMMAAETWLSADDAVRFGFADRVVDGKALRIVARAVPSRIVAKLKNATSATARWKAAVASAGDVMKADRQNPGLRLKMLAEVNRR